MTNLQEILEKLARESTQIVVNPSDIQDLKDRGIKFDEKKSLTIEESINLLFESRKISAFAIAKDLPQPTSRGEPAIENLQKEIYDCVLFGLNGAAITLCGILVEFTLKYCIYHIENKFSYAYNKELWDMSEKMTFGPTISKAKEIGLINEEQERSLSGFKDVVRNPYNHYNIRKISGESVWKKVNLLNVTTGEVETKDIKVSDDPVLQVQAKPVIDKLRVMDIYKYAYKVVTCLLQTEEGLKS